MDGAAGMGVPPVVTVGREAELEARLAEAGAQMQRLAADFENYRRRQAQERDELIRFAAHRVVENLLPVIDNFERALAHAHATDPAALIQGVTMIHRLFMDSLRQQGVEAMSPVGAPFDPRFHEAVGQVETSDHPDGTVMNVLQQGYTLGGKVLRHAMVQVASNPTQAAPPAQAPPAQAPSPGDPFAGFASAQARQTPDITLEDLMAEATVPDSPKEDAHG